MAIETGARTIESALSVRPSGGSGVIISAESPTFKDSDRAVVGAPFMRADADGRAVGDWQL